MSELSERSQVEEIVLGEGDWDDDPFTPTKLMGVAVAGALGALVIYYLYSQLDPDKRESLKEGLMSAARSQMRRWGDVEA